MLVIAVVGLVAILSGCTTKTAGMQAPLAHDYDGVQWRPLDSEVAQPIVLAPGYTALIENDPATGPEDLARRIEELPDDVRGSELDELRLVVRPVEDRAFAPDLSIAVEDATGGTTIYEYDDLRFDGDWVILANPPPGSAGETVTVTIEPATGWEYGVTPGRIPYGGYGASIGGSEATLQPLDGSLGFQTVFEQQTDVGGILSLGVDTALVEALTDPVLLLFYVIILAGGAAVWILRPRWMELS